MIAKYRKQEYPGEWFLTDFTMEQVEKRLEKAEERLEKAEAELKLQRNVDIEFLHDNAVKFEKLEAERDRLKDELAAVQDQLSTVLRNVVCVMEDKP